jgi:hypothetical protein
MQKIIERWSRIHVFNIQAHFENWRFAFSIHHQASTKGDTYDNFAILVMSANRLDIHYILPITCFNKSLISPNSLDASSIERTLPVHSAIMYAQSNHNSCSDEAGRRTDNVALWIILRSIRSRPDPD